MKQNLEDFPDIKHETLNEDIHIFKENDNCNFFIENEINNEKSNVNSFPIINEESNDEAQCDYTKKHEYLNSSKNEDKKLIKNNNIDNNDKYGNFNSYNNKNNNNKKNLDMIIDKFGKESIQQMIKKNIYLRKPFKEKKKLGRKIKSEENLGEHNKFSDDNILRKIKNAVLNNVFDFINKKILSSFNSKKEKLQSPNTEILLFKLKQNYLINSKADYNKEFLNKTLGEIFSQDISTKYTKHPPDHNKEIIEKLINDQKGDINNYFADLFNLTFMDVLEHFRGTRYNNNLEGLKNFDEYCRDMKNKDLDDEYKKILKFFLINYEKEVLTKKTRIKKEYIKVKE